MSLLPEMARIAFVNQPVEVPAKEEEDEHYLIYHRFIENFYRREFLEVFLQPSDRFGLLAVIIGVLAGDVFTSRRNRLRLALFFLLVRIQKARPVIARPIAWEALPQVASV